MNQEFQFLDLDGLEDHREREELLMHLNSVNINPDVKFPWDIYEENKKHLVKGSGTYLNVFAPAFKSSNFPSCCETSEELQSENMPFVNSCSNICYPPYSNLGVSSASDFYLPNIEPGTNCRSVPPLVQEINGNNIYSQCNYLQGLDPSTKSNFNSSQVPLKQGDYPTQGASCVVEQNTPSTWNSTLMGTEESDSNSGVSGFISQTVSDSNTNGFVDAHEASIQSNKEIKMDNCSEVARPVEPEPKSEAAISCKGQGDENSVSQSMVKETITQQSSQVVSTVPPAPRSFADVLKNKSDKRTSVQPLMAKPSAQGNEHTSLKLNTSEEKKASVDEDRLAVELGRHLSKWQLDLRNISLQPRGLINRSNWCYINATLQALLACSPFYSLLRNLPIGLGVERGPSSTPVIDSMVKLSYEFLQLKEEQELQLGVPFQPGSVYEMLGTLKSHCLKGLQEDAEEFLSFILNGMHEEMAMVIKNYEKQYNLTSVEEVNGNGDVSDGEDEWQVIGAKKRGMVTRKVVEHKTPISDLLGGQIKSLLTINGNKTSASVQPFFTLPLDIQSENVTSVEEAMDQMTVKEPVQGYTCAKTKQEVEAYCRIMLQKLPPVLILHLKRFIYNRNGGCKKIMKHTQYPIALELKKDLLSPEAKKGKRQISYKLFAVMYHDGVEALIGHYICDIYHHASKNWIRCDDRNISPITEAQVLSHSPPRVPYLLFYQVCDPSQEKVN